MKKIIIGAAVVAACMIGTIGCSKEAVTEEQQVTDATSKTIKFDMKNCLDITTRASLTDESIKDLVVLDYLNGECVNNIHQVSTESGFGTVSLTMGYGTHTLYFVAAKGDELSYDSEDKTMDWSKIRDTYVKAKTLTVTKDTESSQSVQMKRVSGSVIFQIDDMMPADVDHCIITLADYYPTLDLEGECGYIDSKTNLSRTISLTSIAGKADTNVSVHGFGLADGDEYKTTATITFYKSDNSVIQTYSITNVPIKANRRTVISGNYFSGNTGWSITLDNTWDSDYEMSI